MPARPTPGPTPARTPATSRRIGLVVNPTAGQGRGRSAGRRTAELLAEAGFDVVDLSAGSVSDALAQARAACADGLSALVVVGGDGMVHLGVNAVVTTSTPLAVVAAGSGNDFATSLGLPVHDVAGAVSAMIAALARGARSVDAVHVTPHLPDAPGTTPVGAPAGRWYAGTLSIGLDAAVNAEANTYRWPSGHARYLRAVLACLRTFRPYGYRLTVDGRTHETLGTVVAFSSGPRFGGGLRIAPDAQVDDGLLHVVHAGPLSRASILRIFPGIYRGKHVDHPAVTITRARTVVVEATAAGALPPLAFADGEPVGPVPLRAQIHPGVLRVLA